MAISTNEVSSDLLKTMNAGSSNKSAIQDAQDRFMTLLVEQMKNQDPLNPMDNAQVTSQLAQLSTVTGIDKLNSTLESLISSVQSSQSYQASSMIGHNVLVGGNTLSLHDGKGYFGVNLPVGADNVTVTVKDSGGNVIRKMTMGAQDEGVLPLNWDGLKDDGSTAANGNYKFEVSATIGSSTVEATPLSYEQVLSVSNSSSGIKLNLTNLKTVSTDDVVEIY